MKKVVSIFIFAVIVVIVNAQKEVKNFKTLEFDYMDLSVEPSDDFYQYATGTWMKNNPVPDEESRWSSFNQLSEKNNTILNAKACFGFLFVLGYLLSSAIIMPSIS